MIPITKQYIIHNTLHNFQSCGNNPSLKRSTLRIACFHFVPSVPSRYLPRLFSFSLFLELEPIATDFNWKLTRSQTSRRINIFEKDPIPPQGC